MSAKDYRLRLATPSDTDAAYYVCLKTGDYGRDGEPYFWEDPGALGRIFVGPYLVFEPELAWVLEDEDGVCGYVLGALDSRAFYERYEREWRPGLSAQYPAPKGDPATWSRVEGVYQCYHAPDYYTPAPYERYPSHMHVDLLPRAQGCGQGRRMMEWVMDLLKKKGSPGVHLGVSLMNAPAMGFYQKLGFQELVRVGEGRDGCVYMGKSLGGERERRGEAP